MTNGRSWFRGVRTVALVFAIAILPEVVRAQTASVNGTVTDPSGAVVPAATVSVANEATNAARSIQTGETGTYSISNLSPGTYDITISKDGLKTVKFSGVVLTVDQALTLDARLEVSAAAVTVTVEGTNIIPIDTTDAQVSNIVDQKQIEALPLILRDPYQLVLLTPGATYTNTGTLGFSINGGRDRNNNFQLDGTNNNDPGVPGTGLVILNPDATEEFRVISNSYLPEFGRNSSAVIDIITRSGTNNFHGDVYYFGRWNALGARDFFNPSDTGPQSPYVRNTYGASIGGPVIKNKLFYFFNFEGNRFATATTTVATVPDAAFKTGVFTYVDPTAGAVNVNVSTPGAPNNVFGLALDPQTQKILNFYPAANGPAVVQGVSSQLFFADTDLNSASNYLAKVDYVITPRNTVSVRYLANDARDNGASTNVLPGIGGAASTGFTQSLNGHLATVLSPTKQNDFYASGNRSFQTFTCNGASTIDGLSLSGVDPFGRGRDFALPGFTPVSCFALGDSDGQDRPFGTYNIGDNMTWSKGRHTVKFGFEFADNYSNDFDDFGTRPLANFAIFTNTGTSALANTVPFSNPTVQDAVWGLLGGVFNESQTQLYDSTGTRVPNDERGFRERDIAGFIQDQFKLKPNFTLSFGMRYEWDGVPWVVNDQLTSATPDALAGPSPVQFLTVTRGGANPLYANDVKGFEPRIGFAWDPFKDGKTSIRAGFGYFRDRQFFNLTGDTRANPPFSLPFVNTVYTGQNPTNTNPATAADQISSIPLPTTQPAPSSTLVDAFLPPNFTAPVNSLAFPATISPNFHVPYVQQRNFGIQRQLGGHFNLEVNYVGNKANRLLRVIDGNPPQPALVAQLRAFCQPTNPLNTIGCFDSPTATPQQESVQGEALYVGQQLGLLPFNAVNNSGALHANEVASIANSNYNALQTTLNHQLSHGMSFQVNYTWAHAIDDASDAFQPQQNQTVFPANSNELKREKGNSSFDVRNRAVFNYIAELPFGRGKDRLNSGLIGRVLEGWSWSGIATLQSGFPFEIFAPGIDSDGTGATQRASFSANPTVVPVLSPITQTGPNVGLFTFPLFGGPGDVHRNSFYGPSYENFDMVIAKNTKITERFSVEFRSEYYNVFNHPNFQQPDNFITDGALFGQSSLEVGRNDGTTGARQLQFGMKLHF